MTSALSSVTTASKSSSVGGMDCGQDRRWGGGGGGVDTKQHKQEEEEEEAADDTAGSPLYMHHACSHLLPYDSDVGEPRGERCHDAALHPAVCLCLWVIVALHTYTQDRRVHLTQSQVIIHRSIDIYTCTAARRLGTLLGLAI